VGDPPLNLFIMQEMTSDQAQTKAIRRRALRETFPPPLNQLALRHVDSVVALDDDRRLMLSQAIQKTSLRHAATFIDVLNRGTAFIQHADDLIALIPSPTVKKSGQPIGDTELSKPNPADTDYIVNLLLKCYPDMPRTSADALARAHVMEGPLHVVRATRNAMHNANSDFAIITLFTLFEDKSNELKELINSDFAIITLFTLFEEKSNELKELINGNPAFVKAIQLSRPNW